MSGHRFDPTILREYDIRGRVGKTLHEADARAIGRAFAVMLKEQGGRTVAVGYDGRLSSPALEAALVEGLSGAGANVVRVGLGPTPMLYFAASTLGVEGGIMITGSHNPPDYNGFKMMLGKRSVFGEAIQKLGRIAAGGDFPTGQGQVTEKRVLDAYVDRLLRDYDGERPLHVAWDPGNGATGEAVEKLIAKLPGRHELINAKIDGTFPAHHPDPTEVKNLKQLQALVAEKKCELGIAFDGDGDRIGVIDGEGRILWGDQLMVILGGDVIRRQPGATIIADVKASQVLFDELKRMGGSPLMWRTGHSLIKTKMAETGAPLAGEMSGHIFYADRYYGYDDALYAAVRLLGILGRSGESIARMRDRLPQVVNTPELRFPCPEERKFAVVEEVKNRLRAAGADVNDIDGVRVRSGDGWWLLRASNTQDVLVARAEAKSEGGLAALKAQLADQLRQSGIEPPQL
ncbi:MAG: phosphomannomutase/phosphoglucomutase [Rhodospirillales bacterium]|nr:phosphomannomutase/phosphoglucomutase [Rhodospirillales bacterium]